MSALQRFEDFLYGWIRQLQRKGVEWLLQVPDDVISRGDRGILAQFLRTRTSG